MHLLDGSEYRIWCVISGAIFRVKYLKELKEAGFILKPFSSAWDKKFIVMEEYFNKFGHTDIPAKEVFQKVSIGNWSHQQRRLWNLGELEESKINKLLSVNFKKNIRDK